MPLSDREKLTVGLLSAGVGIVAIGVAMKLMKKRAPYMDYDEDDADAEYRQHIKYLQRAASQPQDKSGSISSNPRDVFNSSRLNVFNSSRLNEAETMNDSITELHDLSLTQLLPDNVRFMAYDKVLKLLKAKERDYVIFDLRDIDYIGGHIAGSMNIADKNFYDEIPTLLQKYHDVSMMIVQCMDGSLRSIENIEYLAKARKELIKNYDEQTRTSFYYQYKLKLQHDAHKTVMRSINWENAAWMSRFVEKKKIEIDFSAREDMFRNLKKQNLFVIAGGFFEFLNSTVNDTKIEVNSIAFHSVIADFDIAHWEQLCVMGEKKLYHRKEYYTTRRINPLRKTQTKREF